MSEKAASLSLRDFVQHKGNCPAWGNPPGQRVRPGHLNSCTCRLTEVLARELSLREQIEQVIESLRWAIVRKTPSAPMIAKYLMSSPS